MKINFIFGWFGYGGVVSEVDGVIMKNKFGDGVIIN